VQVAQAEQICSRQDGSNHDEEQRDEERRDAPGTSPGVLQLDVGGMLGSLMLMAVLLHVYASWGTAWGGVVSAWDANLGPYLACTPQVRSVRVAANADRPLWFPGSPAPAWLDGT
jgi:hypothetical protein